MNGKRDYYEVLGVSREADGQQLKQAYRKVALQYHPDRNPDNPEAENRFKEAAEAYEVLTDGQKRAAYDRFGHDGLRGNVRGYSNLDDVLSQFGGIFEEFFGGGFGGFGASPRRHDRPQRGEDLRFDMTLTFAESARGVERTVEVERLHDCDTCRGSGAKAGTSPTTCGTCRGRGQVARTQGFFSIASPCPTCRGQGTVVQEMCEDCGGEARIATRSKLLVKVPGGVDSGSRLRMNGEGEGGPRGGPPGDLYVFLSVEPHERFAREGNDIILEQSISITQAALGTKIKVPTLDGDAEVTVKAGTQTGDDVSLRGKGFPNLRGFGKGAQIVRFQVQVPTKLSRAQRKLLEQLAETLDA